MWSSVDLYIVVVVSPSCFMLRYDNPFLYSFVDPLLLGVVMSRFASPMMMKVLVMCFGSVTIYFIAFKKFSTVFDDDGR